jgi:hypothetical protein
VVESYQILSENQVSSEGLRHSGLFFGDRLFKVGNNEFSMTRDEYSGDGSIVDFLSGMHYVSQILHLVEVG